MGKVNIMQAERDKLTNNACLEMDNESRTCTQLYEIDRRLCFFFFFHVLMILHEITLCNYRKIKKKQILYFIVVFASFILQVLNLAHHHNQTPCQLA